MRIDRYPTSNSSRGRVVAFALVLLASAGAASAQPQALSQRVRGLSDRLLQLHGRARGATPAVATGIRGEAASLIRQRAAAFEELIQNDPQQALALAFSSEAVAQLVEVAPEAAPFLESQGSWQGPVEYLIYDDANLQTARSEIRLDSGAGELEIHFAGEPPAGLKSGMHWEVSGVRLNAHVAASGATAQASLQAGAACSTTGVQNTAVILVTFPGVASPVSTSTLYNEFFGSSGHTLDGHWRDASYGKTSVAGNVFGPYPLSQAYACDQMSALASAAISAAESDINYANYNRIFVVAPLSGCSFSGVSTVGCGGLSTADGAVTVSKSVLLGSYMASNDLGVELAAHEGGHGLGLSHARSRDFGGEALGALGAAGTLGEYGDYFSPMGYFTLGHYSAPQKVQLGWLPATNYQTVQGAGTYFLQPFELGITGLQALKVQRGIGNNAWLWVEFRQPIGSYESTINSQAFSGPLIHYSDSVTGSYTDLLDFTTATSSWYDPALASGQTWVDPYTNLSISVQGAGSGGATVQVNYGSVPCTPASPTVTLSPVNPSVNAGSSASYSASIQNNDSSGCTANTFSLSNSQPSGWAAGLSLSAVTLSPGQSASVTMTEGPPAGTPPATYPVGLSANRPVASGSGTANLTVMAPPAPPAPVSATLNLAGNPAGATYGTKTNVPFSVNVLSGTLPAAGATVSFTVKTPNGSVSTGTATAGANGVANWSYRTGPKGPYGVYTVTAKATYGGQSAATNSVTFTVK